MLVLKVVLFLVLLTAVWRVMDFATLILSKVAKFRLYDLRHTWATRAAMAGIDLVTLAAMLGHSRIQMVLRYAHPTEQHQTNAMKAIERYTMNQNRAEELAATIEKNSKRAMATTVPTTPRKLQNPKAVLSA
jgi:hypothetical protein